MNPQSIYSARFNLPIALPSAVCGEVSLAGEIRTVKQLDKRIKTAEELGFSPIYCPLTKDTPENQNGKYHGFATVKEAVKAIFNKD